MQRQMLRLTLLLGVMVTLLGGTGVFAVFTDSAMGGPNTVTSGARPRAANLQIAPATIVNGDVACQAFVENTLTPQFSITGLQPEGSAEHAYVCLRNSGSGTLDLSAGATGLRDLDSACTGDEATAGDETCGGDQAGELGEVLKTGITQVDCATLTPVGGFETWLLNYAAQPLDFGADPLAAGATICVEIVLKYSIATEAQIQVAQSDMVTWNFRFEGTAS